MKLRLSQNPPATETLVTRPKTVFRPSMTLLKRIPANLFNAGMSSVANVSRPPKRCDDDTVIELDKLAEGTAGYQSEQYPAGQSGSGGGQREVMACACWEFNNPRYQRSPDHETPHSTDAGPWLTGAAPVGAFRPERRYLLNVVTHGATLRVQRSKSRC